MKLQWLLLLFVACFVSLSDQRRRHHVDHSDNKTTTTTTTTTISSNETAVECEIPKNLTSATEQCAYVRQFCADSETSPGIIHYLEFYYCTMGERHLKWLAWIVMLLQLAFLFVFLGTAASDFFCPNLYTAAEALRLPQDVAGVTLLALGNSAPDLFSSVVAIHGADAISLALGELVGAGLVIGGAVTGCVVLFARHGKNSPLAGEVMDISVDKRIFLRDVGFFLLSILVLVVILFDGKMYWWEGLGMIVLYAIYVAIVAWMGRQQHTKMQASVTDETVFIDDKPEINITFDADSETHCFLPSSSSKQDLPIYNQTLLLPRNASDARSDVDLSDIRDQHSIRSFRSACGHHSDSSQIKASRRILHHRLHAFQAHFTKVHSMVSAMEMWDAWRRLEHADHSHSGSLPRSHASSSHHSHCGDSHQDKREEDFLNHKYEESVPSLHLRMVHTYTNSKPSKRYRLLRLIKTLSSHLFPVCSTWKVQGIFGKIVSILNIPAVILLRLTTPVVCCQDEDEIGESQSSTCPLPCHHDLLDEEVPLITPHESSMVDKIDWHHRYILLMQSILSPLFIIFAVKLWSVDLSNSDEISFRGWALGVCLSASCFTAAFLFTRPHRHILRLAQHSVTNPPSPSTTASTAPTLPWHHPILSFIGFCVGIVWIYVIATEVVGLLKAFGVILDISEAILGMTVFAFGNSIGDFVSNITMARMGYPHMALAASFAGPLLNLLMTLGISGMLGLNEPPREFVLTTNAFLTTFGLLLMQVINLIAIPCQRYRVSRSYGLFLVVLYISIITVTVTLSFTDVQLPFLHPNDSE